MSVASAKAGKSTAEGVVTTRRRGGFREWAEFVVTLILMVFFIRVTTVEAFRIPTGSMENTLLVGDFLLVNKFIYGVRTPDWLGVPFTNIGFDVPSTRLPGPRSVESGDIIVFKYPLDRSLNYIKRCVAGPGQVVEIKNRQLYVDGIPFENPPDSKFMNRTPLAPGIAEREILKKWGHRWSHDNFGPVTVPEKHYFMMGDNRDNSADSRYWGFLPEEDIVGKALIIYFSFDKHAPLKEFYNLVRWERIARWIE